MIDPGTIPDGMISHPEDVDIERVNFNNPDDIIDFAAQLIRTAIACGLFSSGNIVSPKSNLIRRISREWLRQTDSKIDIFSAADALRVISSYDLIHRIAYGKPAQADKVDKYVLKALDAKIHGDHTVDEYDLFRQISAGLRRMDKAYLDKALLWHSLTLDCWHKQFMNGTAPDGLSEHDTAQRVTLLLSSDLFAFEGRREAAFKQLLRKNHLHLLCKHLVDQHQDIQEPSLAPKQPHNSFSANYPKSSIKPSLT